MGGRCWYSACYKRLAMRTLYPANETLEDLIALVTVVVVDVVNVVLVLVQLFSLA